MYLPQQTLISNITNAAQAVVTVASVDGLSSGQYVRFIIPQLFGMVQLNGMAAKVLAIDTIALTVLTDANTLNMDAYVNYTGPQLYTPAQLIPFADGLDPTVPYQTSATLNGLTHNILLQGSNG